MSEPTEAQVRGRAKGAAVSGAMRTAKASGEPVYLEQYGITVHPDGTRVEDGQRNGQDAETDPAESPQGAAHGEDQGQAPAKVSEEREEAPGAGGAADPGDGDPAPTLLTMVQGYKDAGLSDEDALLLASARISPSTALLPPAAPPAPRLTPAMGDPAEQRGPDPEMLAAYNERMKDYQPPVTHKTYETEVKVLFAQWVDMFAAWQSAERGMEVTTSMAIAMMISEHWQWHATDRALLTQARTGPAQGFNPAGGGWDR